ncbi:hypothetical protein [Streptomyces sp. NPDC050388]|uniref:hypothetical protein n=1 Tax=Streptomyces sp. NPDC050388 TaxID=3155781 RepID=UPI00342FC790
MSTRGPTVRRLLALRREGKLTTGQVRSAADVLGGGRRAHGLGVEFTDVEQIDIEL